MPRQLDVRFVFNEEVERLIETVCHIVAAAPTLTIISEEDSVPTRVTNRRAADSSVRRTDRHAEDWRIPPGHRRASEGDDLRRRAGEADERDQARDRAQRNAETAHADRYADPDSSYQQRLRQSRDVLTKYVTSLPKEKRADELQKIVDRLLAAVTDNSPDMAERDTKMAGEMPFKPVRVPNHGRSGVLESRANNTIEERVGSFIGRLFGGRHGEGGGVDGAIRSIAAILGMADPFTRKTMLKSIVGHIMQGSGVRSKWSDPEWQKRELRGAIEKFVDGELTNQRGRKSKVISVRYKSLNGDTAQTVLRTYYDVLKGRGWDVRVEADRASGVVHFVLGSAVPDRSASDHDATIAHGKPKLVIVNTERGAIFNVYETPRPGLYVVRSGDGREARLDSDAVRKLAAAAGSYVKTKPLYDLAAPNGSKMTVSQSTGGKFVVDGVRGGRPFAVTVTYDQLVSAVKQNKVSVVRKH